VMAVMTSLALDTSEHHGPGLADVVRHALQMS
jgi:hypothetical protein